MNAYRRIFFPALKHLDAERAHEWTVSMLALAQGNSAGRATLRALAGDIPARPVRLWGLTFPNVVGVAAGFDKDVRVAVGLAELGFGHVEVGTLTPLPQAGNPHPRIFRLPQDGALINRMGFPNKGASRAIRRLEQLKNRTFVVGISLGKQKDTPLSEAVYDYLSVMETVYPYADYLAVNISSPNTPGLRELQRTAYLNDLLEQLQAENARLSGANGPCPLLVKVAPDIDEGGLESIIHAAEAYGVNGIIAANTTINRAGLASKNRNESGGLSGKPLREASLRLVGTIRKMSDLTIIGVGGIFDGNDAQAYLDAGASLVQLYTGMVYGGPGIAGRILRHLDQHTTTC